MTDGAAPLAVDGPKEAVLLGIPVPSMDGIEYPFVLVGVLGALLLAHGSVLGHVLGAELG